MTATTLISSKILFDPIPFSPEKENLQEQSELLKSASLKPAEKKLSRPKCRIVGAKFC